MFRALSILLGSIGLLVSASAVERKKVLAAYLPSWGISSISNVKPADAGITHLLYAFVKPSLNRETGRVELLLDFEGNGLPEGAATSTFAQFLELAGEGSSAKRMVSLGGWGLSEAFTEIASTDQNRREFSSVVTRFIDRHGLDGVDIDWEYPVEGGPEETVVRPEDVENFVRLAAILRKDLETLGAERGQPVLLTIAVSATYDSLSRRYDLEELSGYVDWFHVMAYDFAGPWSPRTAHVAPLNAPGEPDYRQIGVNGAIAALQELGVPKEKVVLGLGLAGVRFEDVRPNGNQWIGVPFTRMNESTRKGSWNDFRFLHSAVLYPPMNDGEWSLRWDEQARASYWVCPTSKTVISFESIRSAQEKAELVRIDQLRGVMIWSLDKDGDDLPLVRAVSEVLER
ncbi:MAG: glycoside hydrolase family 18 protein [Verrucomicrobiota bacterium]